MIARRWAVERDEATGESVTRLVVGRGKRRGIPGKDDTAVTGRGATGAASEAREREALRAALDRLGLPRLSDLSPARPGGSDAENDGG